VLIEPFGNSAQDEKHRKRGDNITAMARMTLRLDGDAIVLERFQVAVQAFVTLLTVVDRSFHHGTRTVRWRLAELSYASPAMIAADSTDDPAALLHGVILDGVEALEQAGRIPTELSDDAMEQISALGALRGHGGILGIELQAMNGRPGQGARVARVTQRSVATVQDALAGKFTALGSVEGRLEGINIHGRRYFNIYEPVHGKRVRCIFPESMFAEAKDSLGFRVLVSGEVQTNARGYPVTVTADKLRRLRDKQELPSLDDILGIEGSTTGGIESTRFIKERWNGDQETKR
jgi:hypothetical protein